MSMAEKIADFTLSLFVVICVEATAAFTALVITSVLGRFLKFSFGLPDFAGVVAFPGSAIGLAVFLGLMWKFRPRGRQ